MKKLDMMRAIKERGFMAKDVADKLGITTVAMSLRTNAKNPRLDTMVQIAEIIGCDVTDLFYPDPAEEAEEAERKKKEMEEEIEKNMKPLGMDVKKQIAERVPDMIGGKSGGGVDWTNVENVNWINVENAENGGKNQQQQMIQTSTFCPHCGKKVRVGVVLLPEEG